MSFDFEILDGLLNGLIFMGTLNTIAAIAIGTAVVRVVLRQRAIENHWRLRMARWRHQTTVAPE